MVTATDHRRDYKPENRDSMVCTYTFDPKIYTPFIQLDWKNVGEKDI